MSNTSKAIVAGNSGNIRIGGGSHGQNEDIVIYGQDIEKGNFVKFVNYPSTSSVFSDDVEPDNDDVYYENVKPAYVRISDDIVVKFWHDKPFGTSLVAYDSYSYQFNGTSNYNINIHAKWYRIIDNKIDWSSGRKVLFPEITKSPDLFNETGTNVIKVYNYHIYTYDESKNTYVEELDPTGKAYDDGVFPFAVHSGYWAEDRDNAYVEDLSIELQQNGRVNVIVSYGLHSHHDAHPYRDVVYENCRIISFNFEHNIQLNELSMRESDFTFGCGIGYQGRFPEFKSFFFKQYNDLITLGTQYSNDPLGYASDSRFTIDGIPYKGMTSVKYGIKDMSDTSLDIGKTGPVFSFSHNSGIRPRPCNEGFSCRKRDEDNIYNLIYMAHGGTETYSDGFGKSDTIYNSLELQLNDTALAVISNTPSVHYNDYTNCLASCFVDLCIMSKGTYDSILTAHQNNDKIYLNLYRVYSTSKQTTLMGQTTIDCSNINKNTGLFYGSITLKKIDHLHALLIKNATTSVADSNEVLDNAKIYLITRDNNNNISVTNLLISSENAKLATNLSSIKIVDYQVITDTSTASTKTYDYYAVDIMNILTGIPCKIGIKIDRSTGITATISNSVYETTERVQKTSLPYEVEGVSRQAGKHGDMIRVTKRI